MKERKREVTEMGRLFRVAVWDKRDSALLSPDRLVSINGVTQALKPTPEGESEVTETSRLAGVIIWGEVNSRL